MIIFRIVYSVLNQSIWQGKICAIDQKITYFTAEAQVWNRQDLDYMSCRMLRLLSFTY